MSAGARIAPRSAPALSTRLAPPTLSQNMTRAALGASLASADDTTNTTMNMEVISYTESLKTKTGELLSNLSTESDQA